MNKRMPRKRTRHIAEALQSIATTYSRNLQSQKRDEVLDQLRQYFRSGGCPPESMYDCNYFEFTERYILPNIIKNYYLLCELDDIGLLGKCKRVLDLGSGPGTFSLAYALWSLEHPESSKSINVTMVDAVENFLKIFSEIWERLDWRKSTSLNVKSIHRLINSDIIGTSERPDLIVFSNSLVEILRDSRVNVFQFIEEIVKSEAIIMIIDYDYMSSQRYLSSFASSIKANYTCLQLSDWPIKSIYYENVDLGRLKEHYQEEISNLPIREANLRFLKSVWIPKDRVKFYSTSLGPKLVMRFKQAWERHDINILRKLFTNDAVYLERKDKEPFRGLEAICQYWKYNASTQADVKFHPERIRFYKNKLAADWQCRFYRKDLRLWMKLTGELYAQIHNNRIRTFSETFEKKLSTDASTLD